MDMPETNREYMEQELDNARQKMEEARNTYWMMSGAVQTLTQLIRMAKRDTSPMPAVDASAEIPQNAGSAEPAESIE
jgi:hypothetical protein